LHVKKTSLVLAAATAVLTTSWLTAPPASAAPGDRTVTVTKATAQAIAGQYIVTLRRGSDAAQVARALGVNPRYVYDHVADGFSARLSRAQVAVLSKRSDVVRIEQDSVVRADATQYSPPWGLDRIDERYLPLSGSYTYNTTASAVRAYIIDTGIYTAHSQFGSRAMNVYDAFGGNGQDCNGHGTHVAGTVGASTYGVAKAVLLRGVRVLGCDGSGSTSGIIAALDWLRANAIKPAVANMSLGGGYSSSLNTAATNLANSGVFLAVAAGNESQDACNVSPASASRVLTVAASDGSDRRASFSNYGSCVEIYAPGVSVTSTWNNGGTNTISGTSMASPHAAGVAALYKGRYGDAASSTIVSWIVNNATTNVISYNVSGTPNRLLYKSSL